MQVTQSSVGAGGGLVRVRDRRRGDQGAYVRQEPGLEQPGRPAPQRSDPARRNHRAHQRGQHGQTRATNRYSLTRGRGGGGGTSNTCWRRTPNTGAPASDPPHSPHDAGSSVITSSGSATMLRVCPGSPGCFPRGRPDDVRDDRFGAFVYGSSDDGGRDDVRLSLPAWRSSSSTRAVNRSISASRSAIAAACSTTRHASSS